MKTPHSNIVALKHCFYSQGDKPDELVRKRERGSANTTRVCSIHVCSTHVCSMHEFSTHVCSTHTCTSHTHPPPSVHTFT